MKRFGVTTGNRMSHPYPNPRYDGTARLKRNFFLEIPEYLNVPANSVLRHTVRFIERFALGVAAGKGRDMRNEPSLFGWFKYNRIA
jgi:hypothetical protein